MRPGDLGTTVKNYSVIVVSQSEKLDRMSRTAVEKLGPKIKSGRAVKAEAKRFAAKVATKPSILDVEILDVAGLADPTSNRPGEREPIVLHDGKFVPVTHTYLMVAGEHHIVAAARTSQSLPNTVMVVNVARWYLARTLYLPCTYLARGSHTG
jgi:hypothetical protein